MRGWHARLEVGPRAKRRREMWPRWLSRHSKIYLTTEISTPQCRRPTEEQQDVMSSTRHVNFKKLVETKMIRCFEIMQDSRKQNGEEAVHWWLIFRSVCKTQLSLTLSLTLPFRTLPVIKGKKKKQIIFFLHQRCSSPSLNMTVSNRIYF